MAADSLYLAGGRGAEERSQGYLAWMPSPPVDDPPDHTILDPAVPVAQAYAFYRALRERNIPVELVVYPREGHGLNERAHLRDALERQLRWFERYLQ